MVHHHHQEIDRVGQEALVKQLLRKYKGLTADDALKTKIWDELSLEKHLGRVKIPFKVVFKKDPDQIFPDTIEVLLDSKV